MSGGLWHLLQRDSGDIVRVLRRLAILVLLIPVVCFAAAAWTDRSSILETEAADGVKIVALLHEQAANLFAGHQLILEMIVDRVGRMDRVGGLDWGTIQTRTDLLRELEVMDRRLDGASEILLVDADGVVRATTAHGKPGELPPAADRRCFLALSRNEVESCIGQPYPASSPEHNLFSLSQRLTTDGRFDGIVQVAISADYLAGLWASSTARLSGIVTMFTSDGTVLAQSGRQSAAGSGLPDPGQSDWGRPDWGRLDLGRMLMKKIGQSDQGIIKGPLFDGGPDSIAAYAKIADRPVYIGLSLDKSAVLETWYINLAVYGVVSLTAMAGIVLAFGVALRRAHSEHRAVGLWQAEIEQRVKTQEQLRQSQKMEGLGKLTGGIAHDFNNLLTVIVGNLGLMKRLLPEGKAQQYLQTALKASDSAVQLTTRLLAFARKQELEPRAVDLPRLVEGMRNLLLRMLGPDIRLVVSGDPDLWPAMIDPNQTELIILNLAVNARDAMPGGGSLIISASNAEAGTAAPPDLAPGHYVVLTVSDTGTGMDAATLARATEPFFSTKEVGKGTGLGLSMMQGVVSQSRGATRLRSQPGCGTQIELWLPRARTLPETRMVATVQDQPQGCGAILVCDDDLAVLQFVCQALQVKGFQVFPAPNGPEAVAMLAKNNSIRLLILDYTMPEMNGAAVIKELRKTHPDLPVLLMTGHADPEAIQDNLPGVAVLRKPFDDEGLHRRVAGMLEAARGGVDHPVA